MELKEERTVSRTCCLWYCRSSILLSKPCSPVPLQHFSCPSSISFLFHLQIQVDFEGKLATVVWSLFAPRMLTRYGENTPLTLSRPFAALGLFSLSLLLLLLSWTLYASVNHLSLFCSAFLQPAVLLANVLPFYSVQRFKISRCALSSFFSFYVRKCPTLVFLSWSLSFLMTKQTFSSFFKMIFVF